MSEQIVVNEVSIAGAIYGDGYIDAKGRICIHHSVTQLGYATFKADYLEREFGLKMKMHNNRLVTGYSTNPSVVFQSHPKYWVKQLRERWYEGSTKKIPAELLEKFSWDEWAFIYQDDGRMNKISHMNNLVNGVRVRIDTEPVVNRYEICLGHPSDDELEALRASLQALGVETSVLARKDGQRNISISRAVAKTIFFENLRERLHPSMGYKMSLPPTFKYAS